MGLSAAEAIDRDPFARAAAVRAWRQPPDFVSVNLSELGWQGIMRAAVHAGIGVEAGLATGADAEEFARSPFVHQVVRALVEVDGGAEDGRAIAELIPASVPQLWHGYGERTWNVLIAAQAAGVDTRVGLEDVLVLPDGRSAAGNAQLVAAALALTSGTAPERPGDSDRGWDWHPVVLSRPPCVALLGSARGGRPQPPASIITFVGTRHAGAAAAVTARLDLLAAVVAPPRRAHPEEPVRASGERASNAPSVPAAPDGAPRRSPARLAYD